MKKLALIFIIVVYMLSIAGMAVNQFYCCGKLSSESLSFLGSKQKENNDASDCCKTTHQYFKIKDAHISSDHITSPEKYFTVIQTTFPLFEFTAPVILQAVSANNVNAPPLLAGNPIYIFNCTYRI
ncbi:HYC_CC_PP family protein [Panacibacter ginsenosidivorans]|uniref:HYC_CC_PP family protein n=1 Tax=Panacibacter ginsenosidivorans TaxID=1813871 RepID=UPI00131515B6|nr:hypothetical protein [Panacibacter ginsenosidivorans]